ncbi:hypothetical protein [Streptomyces sp. NPDC088258]|uniref:hypothetical protein n=1 Tax=Streptomyces sp. NPDC088258 TaxID=3365849 RepID=UPI003803B5E6
MMIKMSFAALDFAPLGERPNNIPVGVVGAGLLWFGWFGFNSGSALSDLGAVSAVHQHNWAPREPPW